MKSSKIGQLLRLGQLPTGSIFVAIRWLVLLGIWLRFLIYLPTDAGKQVTWWIYIPAMFTIYAVWTTYQLKRKATIKELQSLYLIQVLIDTFLISMVYWLTGRV